MIPSLSSKEHLGNMLDSLSKYLPRDPYEVVVVDMSSTDGTVEMIKSRYPEVKLLEDVPNKGYGAAANAGLARATGTHLLVCNSDLLFREGSIDHIVALLQEVGDDTLLGFRLEGLNGVLQRSALYFPGKLDLIWMFSAAVRASWNLTVRLGRFMHDWNITQTSPVDWVTGAALAGSRVLFDRLGGFDEQFFMFSEEIDLCRRIHDLGGRVLYVPEIPLTHVGGVTLSSTDLRIQWLAESKVRYTRKYHGNLVLFVARLGATAAYLTSFPRWTVSWLRHGLTSREYRVEARRWGRALLAAWRT